MSSPTNSGAIQPPSTHPHPARAGVHSTTPLSSSASETSYPPHSSSASETSYPLQPQQFTSYREGYNYYEVPARGTEEYNDYVNMLFKDGNSAENSSQTQPHSESEPSSTTDNERPQVHRQMPQIHGYYAHGYYQQPFYADPSNPYSAQLMYQQMYNSDYAHYYSQANSGGDYYGGHDERMYSQMGQQGFSADNDENEAHSEGDDAAEAHTQLLAKQAAAQALTTDADGEDGSPDVAMYRRLENLSIHDAQEQRGVPQQANRSQMRRGMPYYMPAPHNSLPPQYRTAARSWADVLKDGHHSPTGAPGSPGSVPMPMPFMMPHGGMMQQYPQMSHGMAPPYSYPTPTAASGIPQQKNWRQPIGQPQDGSIHRFPGQPGPRGGYRGRGGYGQGRGRGGYGPRHGGDRLRESGESEGNEGNVGGHAHRRRGSRSEGPATPKSLNLLHLLAINPAPSALDIPQGNARFFVIKSYSEDDVHKAVKYQIWTSTDNGNKRLDRAYKEQQQLSPPAPVYLFFSVNASGKFCAVAEMTSGLDYSAKSSVWNQTDKWTGQFTVRWIYVKDVPNGQFRHIRLANNENKPVTNSRDTQEVPSKQGKEVMKIFASYALKSSILDDWEYYETSEEQHKGKADQKKKPETSSEPVVSSPPLLSASNPTPAESASS